MANVNNWVRAAQAVNQQNVGIRGVLAETKPGYDNIAQKSVQNAAADAVNAAANNASTANAAIQAESSLRNTKIAVDTAKKERGYEKQAQMTGKLAGGVALLGIGAMKLNEKEEPNESLAAIRSLMSKQDSRLQGIQDELDKVGGMTYKGPDKPDSSPSTDTSTTTGGGSSKPISSGQFDGKKGAYSVADMTRLAEEAGFTPEQARVMGAIGMAESGGRAAVDTSQTIDPGKKNEYSIGLFQVNAQAHGDKLAKLGYSEDDLRDPRKAAKVAKMVYDEVGSFKPWSVFKSGDYTKYLPKQ